MKLATFRHEGKTSGGPILGGQIIEMPAAQPNLPRHMIALLSASEKDRTAGFNFQTHILALRHAVPTMRNCQPPQVLADRRLLRAL